MSDGKTYLHITEAFSTGVLSWLIDVASHQTKQGHRVLIAYSLREETPKNYRELFPDTIEFVRLPMCREIHPLKDFQSVRKIAGLVGQCRPDVVHLHSSKAGVLGRLGVLFSGLRTSVFYTPHGLAHLRQDVSRVKRWIFLSIEQLAGALPGKVLACSQGEYAALKRILPKRWLLRLDNAIDCEALTQKFQKTPGHDPSVTICTLGGIRYQKAPWVFAKVASRIGKQLGGVNVHWLWIGDGDTDYVEQLKTAGVEVTGWLSRDEALARVSACEIYLQTSLWEGLPLSVLEAQCLGLPAVVSQCEGNREAVSNQRSGYVVDSIDGYVECLTELIISDEQRASFSKEARKWVRESYSLERLLADLDHIYLTGVAPRDSGPAALLPDPNISELEGR